MTTSSQYCTVEGLLAGRDELAGATARDREVLLDTARWAHGFLSEPHPQLGRAGAVCPWTPAAIREQLFLLTVNRDDGSDLGDVERTVLHHRDALLDMEPKTGRSSLLKTIVVVFPNVPEERAPEVIDVVQQKLKPAFTERGLMIGEFHPRADGAGVRNPAFRPLRSPHPMLAIRAMVLSDLPFLVGDRTYLDMYVQLFRSSGYEHIFSFLRGHRDTLSPRVAATLLHVLQGSGDQYEMLLKEARDSLTGFLMRRDFVLRIERERTRDPRHALPFALYLARITHFPSTGRGLRDFVRWEVSRSLAADLRLEDVFGRCGDDAFAIFTPEVPEEHAELVALRLRSRVLEKALEYDGEPVQIGFEVKVLFEGSFDGTTVDADSLLAAEGH